MEKGKIIYYPIKLLLGFLIFTEALFWVGPLDYRIPNPILLFSYLIILNIALWLGYKSGVKYFRPSSFQLKDEVVNLLIIAGVVLNVISLVNMWTRRGMTVSFFTLWYSIMNPGRAYYMESEEMVSSSSPFLMLLNPISSSAIPFAIFSWKKLPRYIKWLVVFSIFITVTKWLGVGTRKGIIDAILVVSFCILAKKRQIIEVKKYRKKFRILLVSLIGIFIFYFIFSNLSRHGQESLSEAVGDVGFFNYKLFYRNNCSPEFNLILGNITSYLCQGYRALGLGLSMGILPLAPFGMSWFTIAMAKKIGFDPTMGTYIFALENYGIDMSVNWHTAYLWLASDFSFIGVPIFIYIVGYFFAQTWCDSVKGENILSFPVMGLFVIMVFYLFANNQVLSFSFVSIFILFLLYQLSRKTKF